VRCTACGTEVALGAAERIGFRDTCRACGADLHACRNCAHHDPSVYNECRETQAERVLDRERANRCEWFTPGDRVGEVSRERDAARDRLASLFRKT
jgi:hypothetical protein